MSQLYFFSLLFALICLRVNSSVESVEEYKIVTLPYQPSVDFHQYSGYVTVDEHNGRNLFFYFVEAQVEPASKPLLLWINGGPICSTYGGGAFPGNGPFWPTSNGRLIKNPYSWNREANMLYLDSPAGFGFSYSENTSDYFTNDELTGCWIDYGVSGHAHICNCRRSGSFGSFLSTRESFEDDSDFS